jgi:hypothetical protein
MMDTGTDVHRASFVSEDKALDDDISRRAYKPKACLSLDLDATNCFCLNDDRLFCCASACDVYGAAGNLLTICDDDALAWVRVADGLI